MSVAALQKESEKFKKIRADKDKSFLEKVITKCKECAGEVRNRMNYVQFHVDRACDECGKLHKEFWILNDEFVCSNCLIKKDNETILAKRVCELQSDCATLRDKQTSLKIESEKYVDKIAAALQGEVELTSVELKECLEFLYSIN